MRPRILSFTQTNSWKATICIVLSILFVYSCSKDTPDKISAVKDRSKLPRLHATDITTVISDSGITRYRISAPSWDIFDRASQPYWEFPKGIRLERFNPDLKVDANIKSKYAKFNENEQTWELRGNVKAINLQGELFETEQLFWNQRQERFYSDSLVKITQPTRIITGIGFESDQTMSKYSIKRPQGIFPVDDKDTGESPANAPSNPEIK